MVFKMREDVVGLQHAVGRTAGIHLENDEPGLAWEGKLRRQYRGRGYDRGAEERHPLAFRRWSRARPRANLRATGARATAKFGAGPRLGSGGAGRRAGIRGGSQRCEDDEEREETEEGFHRVSDLVRTAR